MDIDPPTRRALTRLAELRHRILVASHFKDGDSMGVRRLRLLVTLISDTLDVVRLRNPAGTAKEKAARGLVVSSASAHRIVEDALREWDRPADARALADAYVLLRDLATAPTLEGFVREQGAGLRSLLRSAIALTHTMSSPSAGSSGSSQTAAPSGGFLTPGASLLLALAQADEAGAPTLTGGDALSTLVSYAAGFYSVGHDNEGNLCLLATLLATSALHTAPPPAAISLAEKSRRRVASALRFARENERAPEMAPECLGVCRGPGPESPTTPAAQPTPRSP